MKSKTGWYEGGAWRSGYRRGLGALLMLLLLVLLGCWSWPRIQVRADTAAVAATRMPSNLPNIGHSAPDFTLSDLRGDEHRLTDWRGQPILINFWASWCGPCRREMPELMAAEERYQAEGLVVLAVNLSHQDARASVEAFVDEFQPLFPILLDTTGEVAERNYGVIGLPMSFFIDRAGTIRGIYVGALDRAAIDQAMTAMRAELP